MLIKLSNYIITQPFKLKILLNIFINFRKFKNNNLYFNLNTAKVNKMLIPICIAKNEKERNYFRFKY